MIERDALVLARDVLRALREVHSRGERHGAFTRDDIIIKEGIARLNGSALEREGAARAALSVGRLSPLASALAPEARDDGPLDARADLYSWGAMLFEALTGERPSSVEAPSDVVPGLDPRLDAIVRRALAPIEGRAATADELLVELERVIASPRAEPPHPSSSKALPHVRAGFARRAIALAIDAAPFVALAVMTRNPWWAAAMVPWDAVASLALGTTPGKLVCGLRLVDVEGKALPTKAALVRAIARVLLAPGAVAALGVEKRAVHDLIAGSAVAFRSSIAGGAP
jgi:uncharacterized RDD family membrane protein YckC